MKSGLRFVSVLATLVMLAACSSVLAAQDSTTTYPPSASPTYSPNASPQTNSDPPGRVARIQYMAGEVSIQPGGVNDWVAASLNRPLTTSDRVWTDKNSKAELSVGGGYIRMNSEASVTLTNVSDQTVQLELDQGTLELTVRYLAPGQVYEVDTPNLAFTVMKPGVYRFDMFPAEDATWVTVRKGQGEATGRGSAVKVKSGEQVRFGNGPSLQHTAEAAPAPDGFDDWASVRDKRLDSSLSARYVAPGVIGYEDLDAYGAWQTVAPYGAVWVPTSVPVGWAPYRFGHWVWIAPWGWTWVDNAPWGFAPFHYGRWVYTGGYWGWAPGPYRYWSPCYAPALVSWVGGPGWGVGLGFGGAGWGVGVNFGWFPLGWGEPYYPWYRGWHGRGLSPAYIRNVNVTNTYITHVTNITNNYYNHNFTNVHYVNRTVNGAVTAAPGSAIAGGRAMNHAGQVVPSSALIHAPMMRTVGLAPTRSSMLGGQPPRDTAHPTASFTGHNVVTHATPPVMMARETAPSVAANSSARAGAMNAAKPVAASGSNPAYTVHRPPTATGENVHQAWRGAPSYSTSNASHYVPRPPASNQSKAFAAEPASPNAAGEGNSKAVHPSSEARAVPRAPSSSQVQHPAATVAPHEVTPYHGAGPAQPNGPAHPSAPAHSAPASKGGFNEGAAMVPHPPSGYTYRPAAAYSPAEYGRSSYASSAGYGHGNAFAPSAHSFAASPATGYAMGGGGYGARPMVSTGSHGAAGHYSTPGGGGHGGGASHAMHAGGGHSR